MAPLLRYGSTKSYAAPIRSTCHLEMATREQRYLSHIATSATTAGRRPPPPMPPSVRKLIIRHHTHLLIPFTKIERVRQGAPSHIAAASASVGRRHCIRFLCVANPIKLTKHNRWGGEQPIHTMIPLYSRNDTNANGGSN